MNTKTESIGKPRLALLIATGFGLGYLPIAPGTWGSLGGLVLALLPWWAFQATALLVGAFDIRAVVDPFLLWHLFIALLLGIVGVYSASRAEIHFATRDPREVVIDEVSGQHITIVLGCGLPVLEQQTHLPWEKFPLGLVTIHSALNWKYLLLGFILFRVFDIWKPFPARQAESLPGGWGIMADDWCAAVYAAALLWLARGLGL